MRSTSRSASEPPEVPVSLRPFVPFPPAAAGPADTAALLWLRLRRAEEYLAIAGLTSAIFRFQTSDTCRDKFSKKGNGTASWKPVCVTGPDEIRQ